MLIGFLQAGKWHCQPLEHDKYCGLMILPPAGMGLDIDALFEAGL